LLSRTAFRVREGRVDLFVERDTLVLILGDGGGAEEKKEEEAGFYAVG
jgi:hypothetical protein